MTKAKSKIIPEKIHIVQINVIHCQISTGNEYLNNPVKWDNIGVSVRKEDAYNFENNGCRFRLFLNLLPLKKKKKLI